jgi:hypothetical protein
MMQEKALSSSAGKVYLSGGSAVDGWIPPSLRNEHGGGLAGWSESDIVQLLKTARNPPSATFGGMNDVVVRSTQHLVYNDLASIAAYLKTLSPNKDAAPFVDGWIGAASLQLTAADLQEISDAIVRTGAGEGPTIPQLEHAGAAH